jgi:hypothetical protein
MGHKIKSNLTGKKLFCKYRFSLNIFTLINNTACTNFRNVSNLMLYENYCTMAMLFHIIQNTALTDVTYCDMMPENRNSGARVDVHC